MLRIGNLSLRLPHDYADRATSIAHLVGAELNRVSWNEGAEIATLQLPPIRLSPNAADREVAQTVAAAIVRGIRGATK